MPQTLTSKREPWLLLPLAGIQFTRILEFIIRMPLGPQFTLLFAISDAQFAALVSAYTLAAGASGLPASTYIDRFGRKRLLLVLYCLFAVATLACGLAASYLALMSARIAAGIFGGVLSALSQTIVGDVIPFDRRGTFMTLNSAVQSVAMGAAAFVGGNIITRNSQGLLQHYWVAAAMGACASLAAVWVAGRLDLHNPPAAGPSTSSSGGHVARTT